MNDLKSLGFILFWSTSEECGHVAVTEERAKALFKRIPKKGDMAIEKILHGKNVLYTVKKVCRSFDKANTYIY